MARILIVEDETIVAMQLQECLEQMGHSVPQIVDSGDAAINAVVTHRPDLVLMDINLRSFIDGVDAAARIRLLSQVPIIFLTAYPSQGSQDRALKTKPVAYLLKPIDDKALQNCVEQALELQAGDQFLCN
ncbi:MAG TPA: response regulator [Rectinemataceae bacterium]|nr:response regulator [Rectinemataceae bacterium]